MKSVHNRKWTMVIVSLVLVVLAAEFCFGSENSRVVYIKPSSNTTCNVKLCLTLSQLDGQLSHPISNATLILLPGSHSLFFNLSIANLTELSMHPNSSSELIVCQQNASFEFKNISNLFIRGLKFAGCGRNKIQMVHKFYLKESTFVGKKMNGTALELIGTTGFIVNSSFISNKFGKFCGPVGNLSQDYTCGNTSGLFNREYAHVGGAITAIQSNLTIAKSKFEGNRAEIGGAIFATLNSNITIISSAFKSNYATNITERSDLVYSGGALHIEGSTLDSNFISDDNYCQLVVLESDFRNNAASQGGVLLSHGCTVNITSSVFINNSARQSGVIQAKTGRIMMLYNSIFYKNVAYLTYGVLYSFKINALTVNLCYFANNAAGWNGGTFGVVESGVIIVNSTFLSNRARNSGSVIYTDIIVYGGKLWHEEVNEGSSSTTPVVSHVTIHNTYISKNWGGSVLYIRSTNLTIFRSLLNNNGAFDSQGGVLSIVESSTVIITESQFFFNAAVNGIILMNANGLNINWSIFLNNTASENGGVLKVLRASAHVIQSEFVGNRASIKGGVLWSVESEIFLKDTNLIGNTARYGGAIYAYDSTLLVYGGFHGNLFPYGIRTNIADNTADDSGGGIYLYRSNIDCYFSTWLTIAGNKAKKMGGGIHAISSFIKILYDQSSLIKSSLHLTRNTARMGGGIYLQAASELHIQKSKTELRAYVSATNKILNFTDNMADYGGALYIDDKTNVGVCAKLVNHDCFIQVTSVVKDNLKDIIFRNNVAHKTGSDIFGGLLDRCNVNKYAEIRLSDSTSNVFNTGWIDGVTYLKEISNTNIMKIASKPVRLCSCKSNNQPDCAYQPQPIHVRKGGNFSMSLVAVDQVNHTNDNVDIYSSLNNKESGLKVGQTIQTTKSGCTNLTFNAYSPFESEELTLYAEGPCKNIGISQFNLYITFLNCTCPIGFQQRLTEANNNCECECDSILHPYITSCNYSTKSLLRYGNFWIAYLNDTESDNSDDYNYLIYPYCPLDYCLTSNEKIFVNLNAKNGEDAQCANNRSGMLCGVCTPGLSISLGTSRCIPCSNIWPLYFFIILLVALLLGLALVALLLMLNITVATGTLNGLIFYVNIVGANSSSFFQHSTQFVNVFISWLNLEVGFDICFFKGMNTYWKMWLQLAFPGYIILLVVIIILVSERSTRFSRLIAKKNPVATLATLIILSYTKLLHTVIAALSFVTLDYPDGSHAKLWLPDASIGYLSGKHIPLFLAAVFILIIGSAYTILLFFWQWLLHHQKVIIFRWVKYQKLYHFIEPYHAPYLYKHRYWTGLLLLARIILFIVFALNLSSDPSVNLLAIIVISSGIIVLKGYFGQLYKNWIIDIIELVSYFNLILFSAAVFFTLKSGTDQTVAVYVSGTAAFVLVLVILAYHIFHEICLKVWQAAKQKRMKLESVHVHENPCYELIESSKPKPTCTVMEKLSQMSEDHDDD